MKIIEYPAISSFTNDNVFIVDGDDGTKKILVGDAILALLALHSPHNRKTIFRGKNLGATVTQEQKTAIQNGTFEGLCLGDYWEANGHKWRIADFDYWYGTGDAETTSHHVVIVPDKNLATAAMNSTGSTAGGYLGSAMYTTNMASAKSMVTGTFGDFVLNHREYLINTVANGYPSAGAWSDSTVDLMNEIMVFGSYIYTPGCTGATTPKLYTNSATQLALFRVRPDFICKPDGTSDRISFWLRDVVNATSFVRVSSYGAPQDTSASQSYGIRPVFAIG